MSPGNRRGTKALSDLHVAGAQPNFFPRMKIRQIIFPLSVIFLVSACSKETPAPASQSAASAPPSSAAPAPAKTTAEPAKQAAAPAAKQAPSAGPRVIEITANDQMKFSVTRIEAKVGEEIKVVLNNIGQLPKEAMGHNWVLLKPGSDLNAFAMAAMTARDKEYIPDSLKGQVVAATALLGPRKSDEVTFKVTEAGEYPYLCSFPAHAAAGMKGVLVAK